MIGHSMKKLFSLCCIVCLFCLVSCGKKGDPLPQKINQLFSLQNVIVTSYSEGTLTGQGSIVGALENVQAFSLELEAAAEDCIGCPFVPAEKYARIPEEVWGGVRAQDFGFTVFPHTMSTVYRWRLVVYNSVSGLPNVMTPVYKVNKPIEDTRNFVEVN